MVDFDEMREAKNRALNDKLYRGYILQKPHEESPHINEEVLDHVYDWYGIASSLAKAIKMLIEQPHDIESYKKAINSLNRYERARDAK